mgnify:CR=1 FL=1
MARAPKDPSAPAVKREVGPKTLYLIFRPGTDPSIVDSFKNDVQVVTMNSRALIKNLQGGTPAPFVSFQVEAEKRAKGE